MRISRRLILAYRMRIRCVRRFEDRGVPVDMVVYKGFGHRNRYAQAAAAVMEQNSEWFSQWIRGEKPAEEGKGWRRIIFQGNQAGQRRRLP